MPSLGCFNSPLLFYVCGCFAFMYVCAPYARRQRVLDPVRLQSDTCEPPCSVHEWSSDSWEEPPVLLIARPSLQVLVGFTMYVFKCFDFAFELVSCNPDRPWAYCVTEDGLELLSLCSAGITGINPHVCYAVLEKESRASWSLTTWATHPVPKMCYRLAVREKHLYLFDKTPSQGKDMRLKGKQPSGRKNLSNSRK